MSNKLDKEKHQVRLQQKQMHMYRQLKIARRNRGYRYIDTKDAHKYHKLSGATCSNPNCVFCGNPRRMWNQRTIQELKFIQTEHWVNYES